MTPSDPFQQEAVPHGSSLHYALLFLPPERRAAAATFHAFCQQVETIADTVSEPHVASAKLAWWQAEVDQSYHGRPSHPLMRALMPHLLAHGVEERHLLAIIEGSDINATQDAYATWPDLKRYCHLAGGMVGAVLARLYGPVTEQTLKHAHKLGIALKLTDIIAGVAHSARLGRIYLPVDELQRFQVDMEEILDGQHSPRFAALMAFQTQRARAMYDEALALLEPEQRQTQKPGLILASIQQQLLRKMERQDFNVLCEPAQLWPLRKFWLAWKMQALGRW